jgi:hypothetical protein
MKGSLGVGERRSQGPPRLEGQIDGDPGALFSSLIVAAADHATSYSDGEGSHLSFHLGDHSVK